MKHFGKFKLYICLLLTLVLLVQVPNNTPALTSYAAELNTEEQPLPDEMADTQEGTYGTYGEAAGAQEGVLKTNEAGTDEEATETNEGTTKKEDGVVEPEEETAGTEETTEGPEESESEAPTDKKEIVFDKQPKSLKDVEAAIADYKERCETAKAAGEDTKTVKGVYWEYEVEESMMPQGYMCEKVTDDKEFGADYYTFFKSIPSSVSRAYTGSWQGSGTSDDPYQISTPEELKELSDEVSDGNHYTGEYFIITEDLDLSSYSAWVSIGKGAAHPFEGILDGGNHVISNMVVSGGNYRGLFGTIENAELRNIIVSDAQVKATSYIGILAGHVSGNSTIEGCQVKNSKVSASGGNTGGAGGLIGKVEFGKNETVNILNCHVEDVNISSSMGYGCVGGLIGTLDTEHGAAAQPINNLNGKAIVSGCSVIGGSVTSLFYYVGGLIGQVWIAHTGGNNIEVSDCETNTPVKSTGGTGYYVGGLIGYVWVDQSSKNNDVTIKNCHAYGDVTGQSYYVGGLAGFLEIYDFASTTYENNVVVEESSAHGNVKGYSYYNGGLVGHTHNGVIIRSCWATGDVYGRSYRNGGLVGYSYGYRGDSVKKGICVIENSYATGNVEGLDKENGGFIGLADNTTMRNCYATGSVKGATMSGAFAGGLIGSGSGALAKTDVMIENCYATGTTKGSGSHGFVGYVWSPAKFTSQSNFFDMTTTGKTDAGVTGATGLTTEQMITMASYDSSWDLKDNRNGRAGGAGDESSPWYIDEEITYPYFHYQYDGHSKDEVNYNLGSTKYSFADGSVTNKNLGQKRADYTIPVNRSKQEIYYSVKTAGAQGVYFPYAFAAQPFDGAKEIRVPGDGNHQVANSSTLYSLGGVSATDIVSFDPMPYAEKSSDRTPYQEGVKSTYTMRGDLVEYKVAITNPSIRYEWLDVKLTDLLPEGVTLVEGFYNENNYEVKVKVTDTNDNSSEYTVPKDGAAGSEPYYYTYKKATADKEKDEPLTVYLGDLPTADGDTGKMPVIEVTFTAIIDRRAVSMFPLDDPASISKNGDNIRNTGNVSGTIREVEDHTNTFEYDTDFDDENTDPVYDSYKVSYIGNGGKTENGIDEYNEYFLYDKKFTVLGNDKNPFEFSKRLHVFMGEWHSRPTKVEGATEVYNIGDSLGLSSNKNPITSGHREADDEKDDIYKDYYALTDYKLYAPWKEQKGSIKVIKKNDKGTLLKGARFLLERKDGADWKAVKWDDTKEEWVNLPSGDKYTGETNDNGEILLETLKFGTYRLSEVKSPKGYQLLKEPIIIELPYEKVSDTKPDDEYDETYFDSEKGKQVYLYYNQTYTITNVEQFELPDSGQKGMFPYMYLGAAIFLIALGAYIWRRRLRQQ